MTKPRMVSENQAVMGTDGLEKNVCEVCLRNSAFSEES